MHRLAGVNDRREKTGPDSVRENADFLHWQGSRNAITRAHAVFGVPSTGRPLIRPIVISD